MSKNKLPIECDKNGKPIKPRDVDWRVAIMRAAIFVIAGAVLLPVGLTLYILDDSVRLTAALFFYAVMIFLGTYLLLYGVTLVVMSLRQKKREQPFIVRAQYAFSHGVRCDAAVTGCRKVSVRTRGGEKQVMNVYTLAYFDERYGFKRKFISQPTAEEKQTGDAMEVYYLPNSNIGYFVVTEELEVIKTQTVE